MDSACDPVASSSVPVPLAGFNGREVRAMSPSGPGAPMVLSTPISMARSTAVPARLMAPRCDSSDVAVRVRHAGGTIASCDLASLSQTGDGILILLVPKHM